jgi:hypothetical protein
MAALTITAASVVPDATGTFETLTAGVALTAGQSVYRESATGYAKLCDSDSATAEAREYYGTVVNGSAANQKATIQRGGLLTIGATVAAGTPYFTSATAGGIGPFGDLASGQYPTFIGFGVSATQINISPVRSGVAVP